MLFAELVATSEAVASTRARSAKVASLAGFLARLAPEEIVPAVGMLTGDPRQRRMGVGWATISSIDVAPATDPSLGILDVDRTLSELPLIGGAGSAATRAAALNGLFAAATPSESDFLRRLFAGELRQGALAGVVSDGVAKAWGVPLGAVRRAAMLEGDLARVAAVAASEGEPGLAAIGLRVMQPLQPMLASTSADVGEALAAASGGGPASVEWKLDGARIQAHRHGDDVRLYTRNLNDVTDRLPGIVRVVRSLPVSSVVLDGEAYGAGETDRPDLFQETISRFARTDGVAGADLVVRFFDVLHADGEDLLDAPLSKRLDVLDRIAGPWRIPGIVTDDPSTAQAFLDEALAAGQEGVMVKAIDSTYDAGRRGGWRKVKPVKTLDLVVLAAEWGHGRRTGWLSNLHLGARDPGAEGGFVMVGKTFKGLTDELLRWQTETFPQYVEREDPHVVWLRPDLVVEIALDGVQVSTRYPGGVALRFARVRRYRPDKTPADADTIDAVRALLGSGPGGGRPPAPSLDPG